jgi:predicted phage terminase large subunit-like protein
MPMQTPSDAARELLTRREARRDLLAFIKYMNPDYIVSQFAIDVCRELEQFYRDVEAELRPVLVFEAPPQHGKSEIVSRNLPAWLFGQNPDLSIGGLSYGSDLASDMNRDIQKIMMSDDYARIFPQASLNAKRVVNVGVEAKRNSETFEIVGHKGKYVAQGVGGPLTGKKLDIGIIDDPVKNAQEALSPATKNSVWNWYQSTFDSRMSKNSGRIIMATRWALDDLSGRVLESNARSKRITFRAINEHDEALVPELHPIAKLLETKAGLSEFFWSAMYQQTPITIGGGIFKDEWWQYYDLLPDLTERNIYADTAQKTKQQNDYTVFECWGKSRQGKAVLVDMVRGKWEAPELLVQARAFWAKHKAATTGLTGTLRAFKVEDKVSGTGLIQTLRREGLPMVEVPRNASTGDKVMRALDAAPMVQSGNVLLPRNAPWLSDLLAEASAFPNGAHDDILDPMFDAIADVQYVRAQPSIRAL